MLKILRTMIFFGIGLLVSCKNPAKVEKTSEQKMEVDTVQDIGGNLLEGLPGEVYKSQVNSPINWHPWTKETQKLAKDSNRMILAMIALPQQPSYADILHDLNKDETVVREINDHYIPMLIDGDAVREIGILTAALCAEINSGLQLPMLVWFTEDFNPVAWIPFPMSQSSSVADLFIQSHLMVRKMWNEDPEYVRKNSKLDQANRRRRLVERQEIRETSVDPAMDSVRALRQLTSLYDPVSRTFDEAGGLFPCGSLDLLAMGARTEGLPDDIREKSRSVIQYLLDDIVSSAMFDPLDGGVFSSRRGLTWSLPGYYRDCFTQARVAISMLDSYEVTGDKRALDRAMGVIDFIETQCKTSDGLYSLSVSSSGEIEKWLWTVNDVKIVLDEKEAIAWIAATGMKDAGNLPSEVDPLRAFFRMNSFSYVKSPVEIATETGIDLATTRGLLESARMKLFKAREQRLRDTHGTMEANASATFRVVSVFASAYRITGEKKYLDMATETLEKAKKRFSDGPRLRLYEGKNSPSLTEGRAFLYGLALHAVLDVAAVTLDESQLIWADDLATTASELVAENDYFRECPPDARLMDLPITDLAMLFDESTVGLMSMAAARLETLNRPVLKSFGGKATALPMGALNNPILHTDIIQATLMKEYGQLLVYGPDIPEDFKKAIARSPLKGVERRADIGRLPDGQTIKPDEVVRIGSGKNFRVIGSANEISVPSLR